MTTLLDANVFIALAFPEHDLASRARNWFASLTDPFASCPITQGSHLRFVFRKGNDAPAASSFLPLITDLPSHVFWPDVIGYGDVRMAGVLGHRQVTDAYLAQLARHNQGRPATFDDGLAALHSDVAVPIG